MKDALDWLTRTAIVALSGIATLSIIGSIAAIPSGRIEGRLGIEGREPRVETTVGTEEAPRVLEGQPSAAAPGQGTRVTNAMRPSPRDPLEQWLESITYALIAIAALLAVGVFLLWRALRQWRRLAEAAERRG